MSQSPLPQSTPSRRIAVIGCGRVGSVTAACLASLGHRVCGVDIQQELVDTLNRGESPFLEPRLPDLLAAGVSSGRLQFYTRLADGVDGCEAVFVCVDTPAQGDGSRGLERLQALIVDVVGERRPGPLVVLRSTVPPGTGEALSERLGSLGLALPLAVAPEFLREGNAIADFLAPARTVIGAGSPAVAQRLVDLFAPLGAPTVVVSRTEAELVKHLSNAALAMKVSFANESARLCAALHADAERVLAAVGLDPRLGSAYLRPGPGFGGSCLPRDVNTLIDQAEGLEVETPLLRAVRTVNLRQRHEVLALLERAVGDVRGARIGVLGIAFKGGTDDLRESPALPIVNELCERGAVVRVFDPAFQAGGKPGDLASTSTAAEAAESADAVLVLADWEEFGAIDWAQMAAVMAGTAVVDARWAVDANAVTAAGLSYFRLGRSATARTLASTRDEA